jgi:hypothetical protein
MGVMMSIYETKKRTIQDILQNPEPGKELPHHVWRMFGGERKSIVFCGNEASLCENGDFGTLEELRDAVQWYVEQLGGVVNWDL